MRHMCKTEQGSATYPFQGRGGPGVPLLDCETIRRRGPQRLLGATLIAPGKLNRVCQGPLLLEPLFGTAAELSHADRLAFSKEQIAVGGDRSAGREICRWAVRLRLRAARKRLAPALPRR